MKYKIECLYCGYCWTISSTYGEPQLKYMSCEKCKDTNLKARKVEQGNVYGY